MTPEKKQLVFKVLCAMLPYGVVVHTDHKDIRLDKNHCNIGMLYYEHYSKEAKKECGYNENDCSIIISGCYYGDVKPYLRPMSSMTEEEFKEYHNMLIDVDNSGLMNQKLITKIVDWLDEKMFDHRNLVSKGLALKAKEWMYKIE